MTNTLHVWVGTDQWQQATGAEQVLEHSIRRHASCPVEIHWMRAGSEGWETDQHGANGAWKTNAEPGSAWKSRGAWGTPFAPFRFTIPEMMGFEGRAVYLDADMLVRADMAEFLSMDLEPGYRTTSPHRTDVSLIDCAAFKDKKWWPKIAQMKPSGMVVRSYVDLLLNREFIIQTLDPVWNMCDPMYTCPDPGVEPYKLLHYTVVPTQPYKPYPSVTYYPHPWPSWVKAWKDELAEARAETA